MVSKASISVQQPNYQTEESITPNSRPVNKKTPDLKKSGVIFTINAVYGCFWPKKLWYFGGDFCMINYGR